MKKGISARGNGDSGGPTNLGNIGSRLQIRQLKSVSKRTSFDRKMLQNGASSSTSVNFNL
ncbi:MAG TPA: hypothetical protein DDW52_12225 [Planctomycetaceae bacterium]|nr:hypothetical protein [Planctomycetaceae bacterium]